MISAPIIRASGKIEIYAHETEKPYIIGARKPVKLAALEEKKDFLPPQMQTVYESFQRFYESIHLEVTNTLTDGDEIPISGGIQVIHTPGHTPGHICLYHRNSRTLISGDALTIGDGQLNPGPSHANYDDKLAKESLKRLLAYDIDRVICYHGGVYEGNVLERIYELTKNV